MRQVARKPWEYRRKQLARRRCTFCGRPIQAGSAASEGRVLQRHMSHAWIYLTIDFSSEQSNNDYMPSMVFSMVTAHGDWVIWENHLERIVALIFLVLAASRQSTCFSVVRDRLILVETCCCALGLSVCSSKEVVRFRQALLTILNPNGLVGPVKGGSWTRNPSQNSRAVYHNSTSRLKLL